MKSTATAVAVAVGLVVLLDFFIRHPILDALGAAFREWTIILTAFALILGLVNLVGVHFERMLQRNEHGSGYSAVVLVTAVIVAATGLFFGLPSAPMGWVFNHLYVPLQGAFLGLVAFLLASAAYRSLRARSLETLVMLVAALIVLLGQVPWTNALGGAREWVLSVPSEAGVRGILIGVALGTIATGLRLISGLERPYSE